MKPRYKWNPLKRAVAKPPSQELVAAAMEKLGCDEAAARKALDDQMGELWLNDLYQVEVRMNLSARSAHINIRRRDGGPILRDWRHFQWIKNQLVGEECEAVELYPAESRLTDEANKYHLYAVLDPTFRFPFGSTKRAVDYSERNNGSPGMRQRPL